jgi:hypothetical protein
MTTEQLIFNTPVVGGLATGIASPTLRDFVAAMFSLDSGDGIVDVDAVERIREGEFDDWVLAATRSGLFSAHEVEALAQSWHADPRSLFEALLADADDVSRKRYETVWDSLADTDTDTLEYA